MMIDPRWNRVLAPMAVALALAVFVLPNAAAAEADGGGASCVSHEDLLRGHTRNRISGPPRTATAHPVPHSHLNTL